MITALIFAAQLAGAPPRAATWYLQYADRSGMVAISSDVVKEGMSGAYTTWLFVNPEPAPGKPNVVDYKIEFDCISKRFRFDGGVVSNFGSPPRADMTGSDWESPAVGSQLEQDVAYACEGKAPMNWVNTRLGIDDLIEFYYTRILGLSEPKQ